MFNFFRIPNTLYLQILLTLFLYNLFPYYKHLLELLVGQNCNNIPFPLLKKVKYKIKWCTYYINIYSKVTKKFICKVDYCFLFNKQNLAAKFSFTTSKVIFQKTKIITNKAHLKPFLKGFLIQSWSFPHFDLLFINEILVYFRLTSQLRKISQCEK